MAITVVRGVGVTGTGSATVTLPAGIAAGDLIYVVGIYKNDQDWGYFTPSGFTAVVGSEKVGGGYGAVPSSGTGNQTIVFFKKVAVGSESSTTVALTTGAPGSKGMYAQAFVAKKTAVAWEPEVFVNLDKNTGAAGSQTWTFPALALRSSDVVIGAFGVANETATVPAPNGDFLLSSGATFDKLSPTDHFSVNTASYRLGYSVHDVKVQAGTNVAQAITSTATMNTVDCRGPAVLLRLRESLFVGFGTLASTAVPYPSGLTNKSMLLCLGAAYFNSATNHMRDTTSALAGFTLAQTAQTGCNSAGTTNQRSLLHRRDCTGSETGTAAFTGTGMTAAGVMAHFQCGANEAFSVKSYQGADTDWLGAGVSIYSNQVLEIVPGDLLVVSIFTSDPVAQTPVWNPLNFTTSAPTWYTSGQFGSDRMHYTIVTVQTVSASPQIRVTATGAEYNSAASMVAARIRAVLPSAEQWDGTSWRRYAEVWNGTSWRRDAEVWNGTRWVKLQEDPPSPIAWIVCPASNDRPVSGVQYTYTARGPIDPTATYSWNTTSKAVPKTGTGPSFTTIWTGTGTGPSLYLTVDNPSGSSFDSYNVFIG